MGGVTQCVAFCDWLVSAPWPQVRLCCNRCQNFLPLEGRVAFQWTHPPRLGFVLQGTPVFPPFSSLNRVAVNVGVWLCHGGPAFSSLGRRPRGGLQGHSLLEGPALSPRRPHRVTGPWTALRAPGSPHPHRSPQFSGVCVRVLYRNRRTGVSGRLLEPLICISLVTSDVEHLVRGPPAPVCLLWRNVCLSPLPVLQSGHLTFFSC